jgi:small-conductance mechanosensitive channel
VKSTLSQPLVSLEKIDAFVQLEPALLILGLALGAWMGSRVFLRKMPEEREKNLKSMFKNLGYHLLIGISLFAFYFILHQFPYQDTPVERFMTYVGLAAVLSGSAVFVKVCRILVYEYFFLSHRRVPFPVLLINLFTLLLSIMLAGWIGSEIFNIRLAPLLATSAIFTAVLGLALQDTLGNLFAGVALQFDKPYEIGDWVEVHSGGQKWVGQIFEISWRATVLIAFTEEAITVPNRVMGQAQILNFSTKFRPIIRSQVFRLPFGVDIQKVKELLLKTARGIHEIRKNPPPRVLVSETNESWIAFKLVYFIDNYGDQYLIADQVFTLCLADLQNAGYQLATHRVMVIQENGVAAKITHELNQSNGDYEPA